MKISYHPSKTLARNTILNALGNIIPLVIGVFAFPIAIRYMGTDAFGVLSIAWAVIGYFGLFNFGLGRATTKFVAEHLGKNEHETLPHLIWTSLALHAALGILSGILLAISAPYLISTVFNIPQDLILETQKIFLILSFTVPFVVFTAVLNGLLAAVQRFDIINAIRIPASGLNFLTLIIAVPLRLSLSEIVFVFFLIRISNIIALFIFTKKIFPGLNKVVLVDRKKLRQLLAFSGWVTISNFIGGPIMVYLDRFMIGSLLTMSAVTFYTAPYEIISRLWFIPVSLVMTLFPAFSFSSTSNNREELINLFIRPIKYILIFMSPIIIGLMCYANKILQIWLGGEFPEKSTVVIQILAFGVLINSLGRVAVALLQGIGHPEVPAKFLLLEMPFYIPVLYFLIVRFGITGAAVAWSLRIIMDTFLLLRSSFRHLNISFSLILHHGIHRLLAVLIAFSAALALIFVVFQPFIIRIGFSILAATCYLFAGWLFLLDSKEKQFVFQHARRLWATFGGLTRRILG